MIRLFTFRTVCIAVALCAAALVQAQDAGIWQTYIVLQVDTPANQWYAGGENADGATEFDTLHLQNFNSLKVVGGEVKSWKNNGGDVTGASMSFRLVPQGGSGTYTEVNLPFFEDLPNQGDQKWQSVAEDYELADTLTAGVYKLETFWKITTSVGDRFDNNGGNNYKAMVTVWPTAVPQEAAPAGELAALHSGAGNLMFRWNTPQSMQAQLQLVDVNGRVVAQRKLVGQEGVQVLRNNLPAGVYMAVVQTANGQQLVTKVAVAR